MFKFRKFSTQSVVVPYYAFYTCTNKLFIFIYTAFYTRFILITMYDTQRAMTNEKKKSQRAASKNLDQHDDIQSITFKDLVCIDSIHSCQS